MDITNMQLNEFMDIVPAFLNQDANSDISGDWVDHSGYARSAILLSKPAGSAGDDLSIVINEATDNAGTSSQALTFTYLSHKIGTATTWTNVTLTTPSSDLDLVSVNGTDLATDTSAAHILVHLRDEDLDVDDGFTHLQLFIEGDDIGNALVISAYHLLYGPRYSQRVLPDPTD